MKAKVKFRSFWRHNKNCIGMHMFLFYAAISLILPNSSDIVWHIIAIALSLMIWIQNRIIKTNDRIIRILNFKLTKHKQNA